MSGATTRAVFTLPDLGEGLHEAEIVSWHVTRATTWSPINRSWRSRRTRPWSRFPSPRSARVVTLHGGAGDRVAVGDPLVEFESADAAADTGTVVGTIEATAATAETSRAVAPRAAAGRMTPAVRALARKLDVDTAMVQGTGPGGAITTSDVERAAQVLAAAAPAEPLRGRPARDGRAHGEGPRGGGAGDGDRPGRRGGVAGDADVTLCLIRAVAAGCAASPALNAWSSRRRRRAGCTTGSISGLRWIWTTTGCSSRATGRRPADAVELKRGLERLKADVRQRTIPLGELRGQTITLSNFGTVGGQHAALVVVPPQVAILGVGRMTRQVVAAEGAPAVTACSRCR